MDAKTAIALIKDRLDDSSIDITLDEVNAAVLFVAANTYLPGLLAEVVVTFGSDTATITGVTNASPIVVTTDADHPFLTGGYIKIADVLGNTAANGSWFIQKLTSTTFSLLDSEGNADYVSGGTATERHCKETLSSDFHHDVINPANITASQGITLRSSKQVLYDMYSLAERHYGDITDLAVEDGTLYALPVPKADQIITFSCYEKPTTIAAESAIPTCIPTDLHEALIVNRVLMLKFPLIEDGDEGRTPNTDRATSEFNMGIALLRLRFPSPAKQKKIIKRKPQFM